ncbi:YhbY family RNA-binding protein [Candidatus Bathyarchaeota archaeon]|nr:YhbY family RNA-binding protein [Candidatus Bathyarchaeota archaeon]
MSGITAGKRRFVKRALGSANATVRIGKDGASIEVLKEIEKQLEKSKMVKVKILQTALKGVEAKHLATSVAEKTQSSLVEVKGHTFMLYKPRQK